MDNTLIRTFMESLEREGKDIIINSTTHKVFFRRNEKGETDPYITMYALLESDIKQGDTFLLKGSHYLILKSLTKENDVYQKFSCVLADETIKWMYAKGDLVLYNVYMIDLNDSMSSNKYVNTSSSKCEIVLSLDDNSKRITINGRFFIGCYQMAWKVTDINYKNGLCYLYAERDQTNANDDTTNGIANRWTFEDKPSNYVVSISQDTISIDKGATSQLTVSVSKDGTVLDPTPTINYKVGNSSICSIDELNVVTALEVGSTTIVGSYKVNEYDTFTSDSVSVTVSEPPIVADIVVTPAYNESTQYKLCEYDTTTFTCSLSGVSSPQWNITLNRNGIPTSNFVSVIDNSKGTFKVTNNTMYSGKKLIYTITEQTTGKSLNYEIRLAALF